MTYDVKKDFKDDDFKVKDANGEKVPLEKSAGDTFIPAEISYPAHKVNALVANGTLVLVEKPSKEKAPAKKK